MATFHTGFSSIGGEDYETDFERGSEYGFDFVELAMNDCGRELIARDAAEIRDAATENGVEVIVHLPFGGDDLAIGSSDEAARDASVAELRNCLRAAGSIDARKAVLHIESSTGAAHLLEDDGFDQLVEAVAEIETFARA